MAHRRQVIEISWRCQNRLHERNRKLAARGKTRQKAQIAMARELAAFVWEVMRITTPLADGSHVTHTARSEKPIVKPEPAAKKKAAPTPSNPNETHPHSIQQFTHLPRPSGDQMRRCVQGKIRHNSLRSACGTY